MSTATTLAPGLHRGLSMEDYLALDAMSGSRLAHLARSPLQYRHALTAPAERTEALDRGTALHLAVLEPELFASRYVVAEPCDAILKSGKRAGETCGNPGLFLLRDGMGWACGQHLRGFGSSIDDTTEVLAAETHERVIGMRDAILAHPLARSLFDGAGEFECSLVFESEAVLCKSRPDRLVRRAGMNVQLKSTRDASPRTFPRDAENRGYFRSLALCRRGLRALGWPYRSTAVLAIEPEPPFDLACYLVDEAALDSADREVSRLLARYRMCTEAGDFPGYTPEMFATLTRPAWAQTEEERANAA